MRLPSRLGGPMNKGLQEYCCFLFIDDLHETFNVDPNLRFSENYWLAKNFWKQFL
jgi:hypothetical protein